jgi:hypothetical protein
VVWRGLLKKRKKNKKEMEKGRGKKGKRKEERKEREPLFQQTTMRIQLVINDVVDAECESLIRVPLPEMM